MDGGPAPGRRDAAVVSEPRAIRLVDLAVAVPLAGLAAPVVAASALAIRLDDGGPVFYTQTRVGAQRQPFTVYKLRTMRDGAVTRVGRWLRRSRVDELPQLWNVVRGDMSLVGPRPITPADVARLAWTGPDADARWSVRPGITGPTQLSTVCDAARALQRDVTWATSATVGDHLACLGRTVAASLLGRDHPRVRSERWA